MKKLFVLLVLLMTSFADANDSLIVQFREVTPVWGTCLLNPPYSCKISSNFSLKNRTFILEPTLCNGIPCWAVSEDDAWSTRCMYYNGVNYGCETVSGLRVMITTDSRYCGGDLCIVVEIGEIGNAQLFTASIPFDDDIFAVNVPNNLSSCQCFINDYDYGRWTGAKGGTVYVTEMATVIIRDFPDFGDMANCWQTDLNDPNNPCWIWDIDADKQVGIADLAVWLSGWLIE